MSQIHLFTSAALNYIPKVRMLFNSIRKVHPEFQLHLALADLPPASMDLSAEPFDHLSPISELAIPKWRGWAFGHSLVELSTAIKPFMLAQLLALPDCSKVLYLDPDMIVFSTLDEILETLERADIVLTPHQTTPEKTLSAVIDNEICSLKHGIYNLGFIGVHANDEGKRFAHWWGERVYHFCRDDIPNGLFTDQRWIDLVPAFFEGCSIMRTSRFNVATWNLTTRRLSGSFETGFEVDGEPLGFYHFTGFDSGAHRIMAIKNAVGNHSVMQLIEWYERTTKALARDPLAQMPWAFGCYSNGQTITPGQRWLYRDRVDLQRAFPDPMDDSQPDSYFKWYKTEGERENLKRLNVAISKTVQNSDGSLTPGFLGFVFPRVNWRMLGKQLRYSLVDKKHRNPLIRRAWTILCREGLAGLIARVRRFG